MELTERTSFLNLWSEQSIQITPGTTITGVLEDANLISLIDCHVVREDNIHKAGRAFHKYRILARLVVIGSRFFFDEEGEVSQVSLRIGHSNILFHDTEAYGSIYGNEELSRHVAKIGDPNKEILIGDWSWVGYYTGKGKIFNSNTKIGQVSARHAPLYNLDHGDGIGLIKNAIIDIEFDDPVTVSESLNRIEKLIQFIDIILGWSQNITRIEMVPHSNALAPTADIYPGYYGHRRPPAETGEPTPLDLLVDPVRDSSNFARILRAWMERNATWHIPRSRLARAWDGKAYDEDRIVSAANSFDLVPRQVYGKEPPISADLSKAIDQSKAIFRKLPPSEVRADILGSLGRIGGWRLKNKIRHRAGIITDQIGELLPEIVLVTDEAVNLRNFYVHGTDPRVGADKHSDFLVFLTQALEFVFIASDLVDMGWDIVGWCSRPKTLGHPFQNFLSRYARSLDRLKSALP